MTKSEARKEFRSKRLALSPGEKMKLDDLMLIQFQSVGLPFVKSLLSYWPIEENNEPDTHLFTEYIRFRNPELVVCYPRTDFANGVMQAIATDIDTPFTKTTLNIVEPVSDDIVPANAIDIVLIPLLAFDEQGFRVGYGKGFYDKWLAECRPDCQKIGFSYFEPIDSLSDRNEFDVPLDLCITPHSQYVF